MATHEQQESTSSHPPRTLDPTTTATPQRTIHVGTRRSKLAVAQADSVTAALRAAHPEINFEIHAMATMGDKNQVTPLHDFGAKSLWTFELENGLLNGDLDLIVHCCKDMPTQLPAKCEVGAILDRENPRDVVVMKEGSSYKTLAELPEGSVVGTSSVRRSAQIARKYPGLKFKDVRGNLGTRLSKLDDPEGEYACLILAAAGLVRIDLGHRITQWLDSKTPGGGMLYSVGQGALAIEIREGDAATKALLKPLEAANTALECYAERSVMRTLEGGCSVPIGVETEWVEPGKMLMRAIVVSLDGSEAAEAERLGEIKTKEDAEEFGIEVARILVEHGAGKILEAINLNRKIVEEQGNA
jgi:hydroxymethylbilane synthase